MGDCLPSCALATISTSLKLYWVQPLRYFANGQPPARFTNLGFGACPTTCDARRFRSHLRHWKTNNGLPPAQGLYDPANEHDACGMGFVASIRGEKSHQIIEQGIQVLINLTHRGACGCDPETGDGAGVLIQIPHRFFLRECARLGFTLPPEGEYGVGMTFLPVERHQRLTCEGILEHIVREEGLTVLGWRDTPIDGSAIGRVARGSQPYIEQIFVGRGHGMNEDQLERKLYVIRKRAE